MGGANIPDDVARFIAEHVDSVELLEVLLLVRSRAPTEWNPAAVADELRIHPMSAGARLETLASKGFVSDAGGDAYRYSPTSTAVDVTIRRLGDTYAERRVAVITAIFSKPSENVRSFADAFKIRKKD